MYHIQLVISCLNRIQCCAIVQLIQCNIKYCWVQRSYQQLSQASDMATLVMLEVAPDSEDICAFGMVS